MASNRTESGLKKDIEKYFKEADQEDAREDELYGPDRRGDELPPELSTREKADYAGLKRPRSVSGKKSDRKPENIRPS